MIHRQLDANHDWTFGKGVQNFAREQQAIALNIDTLLLSWVGDCFFNLQSGVNWKQLLNYGQQANLDAALQSVLSGAYGVVRLVSASVLFNPSTRNVAATYVVDTVYSQSVKNQITIFDSTGAGA